MAPSRKAKPHAVRFGFPAGSQGEGKKERVETACDGLIKRDSWQTGTSRGRGLR